MACKFVSNDAYFFLLAKVTSILNLPGIGDFFINLHFI